MKIQPLSLFLPYLYLSLSYLSLPGSVYYLAIMRESTSRTAATVKATYYHYNYQYCARWYSRQDLC
jgi:hypothetical protein